LEAALKTVRHSETVYLVFLQKIRCTDVKVVHGGEVGAESAVVTACHSIAAMRDGMEILFIPQISHVKIVSSTWLAVWLAVWEYI
jgi:hypothetical protein